MCFPSAVAGLAPAYVPRKSSFYHFCGRRIADMWILDRFMSFSGKVRKVPPSDLPSHSNPGLYD